MDVVSFLLYVYKLCQSGKLGGTGMRRYLDRGSIDIIKKLKGYGNYKVYGQVDCFPFIYVYVNLNTRIHNRIIYVIDSISE